MSGINSAADAVRALQEAGHKKAAAALALELISPGAPQQHSEASAGEAADPSARFTPANGSDALSQQQLMTLTVEDLAVLKRENRALYDRSLNSLMRGGR